MKCRVCREPAVIDVRRQNANYCRDHFLRMCRDQVAKAIDEFDMLRPGERVYNAPPATRGAGQTVAVLAAGDVSHARSDLGIFESRQGLPRVRWTTVPVGAPSTDLAGSVAV